MKNLTTKSLREEMIEKNGLDIPYNAEEFIKWLTNSELKSHKDAVKLVELIRQADIEIWEPGDPEIFQMISSWITDAAKSKYNSVRTLLHEFVFTILDSHIRDLNSLKGKVAKESTQFLDDVLEAYRDYMTFMRISLNYTNEELENFLMDEDDEISKNNNRYPLIPLDNEFKQYLTESRYSIKTRDKMMSKLRKLNYLIINTGRGDSDWLRRLVDKVQGGENIRYARLWANNLIHNTMGNIAEDTGEINMDDLKGGLTSLNRYLDFLITTYKTK